MSVRPCMNPDHPAKRHGHYGYGGIHWCSDFASPLLSEGNMGVHERGRIVVYAKAAPTPTEPTLAEYRADLRAKVEALAIWKPDTTGNEYLDRDSVLVLIDGST